MKSVVFTLLFSLSVAVAIGQKHLLKQIAFNNKRIAYSGRIDMTDSCAALYWTGSYADIYVKNTRTVNAIIADNKGNNFYYVIVDKNEAHAVKINVGKGKRTYTLATFNEDGKHQVELFKLTNTDEHITSLFGFEIDKVATLLKPEKKPRRKIEFFGNSITCGHGVDVPADSADSGAPPYFNNYKAYGAITARHFNAQYHCTSKSGIGVTVSWFPQIMPEIYDRINPNDPGSKWNFGKFIPDIVVVNLFQNDSWIVNQPGNQEFKNRFGSQKPTGAFIVAAYANFIRTIRTKYPKAQIICSLGNMDATQTGSRWPGYIEAAVASLQDSKIATHFFAFKNTSGHPKAHEQQAMANSLIEFIEKGGYW